MASPNLESGLGPGSAVNTRPGPLGRMRQLHPRAIRICQVASCGCMLGGSLGFAISAVSGHQYRELTLSAVAASSAVFIAINLEAVYNYAHYTAVLALLVLVLTVMPGNTPRTELIPYLPLLACVLCWITVGIPPLLGHGPMPPRPGRPRPDPGPPANELAYVPVPGHDDSQTWDTSRASPGPGPGYDTLPAEPRASESSDRVSLGPGSLGLRPSRDERERPELDTQSNDVAFMPGPRSHGSDDGSSSQPSISLSDCPPLLRQGHDALTMSFFDGMMQSPRPVSRATADVFPRPGGPRTSDRDSLEPLASSSRPAESIFRR